MYIKTIFLKKTLLGIHQILCSFHSKNPCRENLFTQILTTIFTSLLVYLLECKKPKHPNTNFMNYNVINHPKRSYHELILHRSDVITVCLHRSTYFKSK